MNLDKTRPSEPPGGTMKRKDWATLLSLMAAQTTLILGIGAFGFYRLEARMDRMEARMETRMDRIEERLDDLDRRVARIEGFLGLAEAEDAPPGSGRPARPSGSGAPPDR